MWIFFYLCSCISSASTRELLGCRDSGRSLCVAAAGHLAQVMDHPSNDCGLSRWSDSSVSSNDRCSLRVGVTCHYKIYGITNSWPGGS